MIRLPIALASLTLLAGSCASADIDTELAAQRAVDVQASQDEAPSPEDHARELHEKEQALEIARMRAEVTDLRRASFETSHAAQMETAKNELDLARRSLEKFTEVDRPARVADAELDLRTTKERAQEAAEELAQIEIMYEDQDLNDKTAEFVVARGRRQAERAEARIAIQEARFESLTKRELPMEQQRLEMAVTAKAVALSKAELEGKIGQTEQDIALREAHTAVDRAERELQEAREEGADS